MAKYLNLQGLQTYDSKIKAKIASDITAALVSYYTKTEVDDKIAAVAHLKLEVVEALPTTDIKTDMIYLAPKSPAGASNTYDEYIYVNGKWEKIGDTEVDLSGYLTTQAAASTYATAANLETVSTKANDAYTMADNMRTGSVAAKKAEQDGDGNIIKDTYATKTTVKGVQNQVSGLSSQLEAIDEGRTAVPKAAADEDGNNIKNTYATQTQVNALANGLQDIETGVTAVPKAEGDEEGNNIKATYATNARVQEVENVNTNQQTAIDALNKKWDDFTEAGGGEPNVLEAVKVNGVALEVTERAVNIPVASATVDGAMSKDDKSKLDAVAAGATADSAIETSEIEALFA